MPSSKRDFSIYPRIFIGKAIDLPFTKLCAMANVLLLAGLACHPSQSGATGIPTVDLAQIAQNTTMMQTQAKELVQMIDQVKTAKNQLDEAKKQLSMAKDTLTNFTGPRGLSALLDMPGVRQQIPADFMASVDTIRTVGAAKGANNAAKAIYERIKVFGCDERYPGPPDNKAQNQARRLCEADAYANPTTLAMVQDSVARSQGRMSQINGLLKSIDSQKDAKAAADLQSRIAAEGAYLANERQMMEMALVSQNLQKELLGEQIRQTNLKKITSEAPRNLFK
jgi:type IV secretion system protein VirB5